jgi:hypothetical protein
MVDATSELHTTKRILYPATALVRTFMNICGDPCNNNNRPGLAFLNTHIETGTVSAGIIFSRSRLFSNLCLQFVAGFYPYFLYHPNEAISLPTTPCAKLLEHNKYVIVTRSYPFRDGSVASWIEDGPGKNGRENDNTFFLQGLLHLCSHVQELTGVKIECY